MPPRRLEEFEIIQTLGVGTVGAISQARDVANSRIVALKILHPTVSNDPLIRARFGREMMILEKLAHRNIIRYYGGGRAGEQLFYAMELVDGGTVREMLEQSGRLPWREAATCAVQVCSALQHAHNHGVIHRDLKPANLLLTADGELKLADFGIAHDVQSPELTNHGLTVGTYAYMAPEQVRGVRNITGKADLYALGCLLYEMLTGQPPFRGDNFAELFEQHLHSPPPQAGKLCGECPAELDALIARLLSKAPEDRPFNARHVQAALMRLLEDRSPSEASLQDVAADAALARGRSELSDHLRRLRQSHQARQVSWLSLACLLLVVVGAVGAAVWLGV